MTSKSRQRRQTDHRIVVRFFIFGIHPVFLSKEKLCPRFPKTINGVAAIVASELNVYQNDAIHPEMYKVRNRLRQISKMLLTIRNVSLLKIANQKLRRNQKQNATATGKGRRFLWRKAPYKKRLYASWKRKTLIPTVYPAVWIRKRSKSHPRRSEPPK